MLADDNPAFLEAAGRFLATQPVDVDVVGEARTGYEAIDLLAALEPDLLLLDIVMPGLDGLAALRLIKARKDPPRVIVVTMHDDDEYRAAGAAAGADGFVAKQAFTTALVPLIRRLFDAP